jgi:deoxyribodipyrimidine photolyase
MSDSSRVTWRLLLRLAVVTVQRTRLVSKSLPQAVAQPPAAPPRVRARRQTLAELRQALAELRQALAVLQ